MEQDPNITLEDGWTTLMLACEKGYPKTVAALLNIRHTDVNLMTSSGATAYGIAELKNDKETKLFSHFHLSILCFGRNK